MTVEVDAVTRTRIMTALNCGDKPAAVARDVGVPIRTVLYLAKRRRVVEKRSHLVEDGGVIMHSVGEPERWEKRPQRVADAQRRKKARDQRDALLRRFGLDPRASSISITPGAAPSLGDWKARSRRGVKAQRARLALEKVEGTQVKRPVRKARTFSDFDDGN